MGNFSSCTCTGSLPRASPSPLPHSIPSQHLAKVLLIDGSMLKFRTPIRVTKLLFDYPNHLVCLLDSLKPGLHSLSTLLPHDKLQLGRLYLLLPFKSNAAVLQESCGIASRKKRIPQKAPLDMQERGEPTGDKWGFAAWANGHKRGNVSLTRNGDLQSTRSVLQHQEEVRMIPEKNEDQVGRSWQRKNCSKEVQSEGFEGRTGVKKNGDEGLHDRSHSVSSKCSYEKLNAGKRGETEIPTTCSSNGDKPVTKEERRLADSSKIERHGLSSLCDTPELQRAYRSFLRRSSSLTSRLQPIVERR